MGKHITLIACVLLVVYSFPLYPRYNFSSPAESILDSALFRMYNYEFEKSNILFQKAATIDSLHPLAPLGILVTRWEMNQDNRGFKEGNQLLLKDLDRTIAYYKRLLDHPEISRPAILLFYGATRGLKSRVLLAEKDWAGVLLNGYKAIQYVKEARDLAPELWDVYMPIGVYEYYVGISSHLVQFLADMFVMEGNRERGIEHLKIAAEKGVYGKREAMGILAFVLLYMEEDYNNAIYYAEALDSELPNNPYYAFIACEARLVQREIPVADRHLNKIKRVTRQYTGYLKEEWDQKIRLLEGTRAFVLSDYTAAEALLTQLAQNYSMEFDWHLSYVYLRLGMVLDVKGRREKAIGMYENVLDLDSRTSAAKWAKVYLNHPFSEGSPIN